MSECTFVDDAVHIMMCGLYAQGNLHYQYSSAENGSLGILNRVLSFASIR